MIRSTAFANSLAAISALVFVLCRLLVSLAPDTFMAIAQSWLHGIVIQPEQVPEPSVASFVLGIVSLAAAAWLFGYAWAWLYNKLGATA